MLRTKTINTTLHLQKEMKRKFTSCNIASTPPLLKMYSRKYLLSSLRLVHVPKLSFSDTFCSFLRGCLKYHVGQ